MVWMRGNTSGVSQRWQSTVADPEALRYTNDLAGQQAYARALSKKQTQTQSSFTQAADQATAANEERYTQGLSLFDEIIARYQPGGGFGEGAMASYEQGKTSALANTQQSLVSSGLSNTTTAAGAGIKYEQEVGTPFRLQLEDMRMNALTNAQTGKAGFIQSKTDAYPNAELFASLTKQASGG